MIEEDLLQRCLSRYIERESGVMFSKQPTLSPKTVRENAIRRVARRLHLTVQERRAWLVQAQLPQLTSDQAAQLLMLGQQSQMETAWLASMGSQDLPEPTSPYFRGYNAALPKRLVGRDTLLLNIQARLAYLSPIHIVPIVGPAGVGKTTLAQYISYLIFRAPGWWGEVFIEVILAGLI